jgi:hypothetical protein
MRGKVEKRPGRRREGGRFGQKMKEKGEKRPRFQREEEKLGQK